MTMATVFEGLIQNIPAIFYRCNYDKNWTIQFINNAILALTGYPASDFIGNKVRPFTSVIHPEDSHDVELSIREALDKKQPYNIEFRMITQSGEVKWVSETGVGVFLDSGELQYLDGFILDVSERKKMELALKASEQQIRDMAFTDSVTGLANRNLFTDRLDQLIITAKRYQNEFSLLFIDLDKFKIVNDTHGHLVGDKLLSLAGERISATFRESDVIARFGGDEFLVIVKNTQDVKDIESIATKLLQKLAEPYYIDNLKLFITASIGIAICPNDSRSSSKLIQLADKAMYKAKEAGRNRYCIHNQQPKTVITSVEHQDIPAPILTD